MKKNEINDSTQKKFDLYKFVVLLVAFLFPLIFIFLKKKYTYIELFDRISIPLIIAVFSYFWLKFTKEIEDLNRLIFSISKQKENFEKHLNRFNTLQELKDCEKELDKYESLFKTDTEYLDSINKLLRNLAILVVVFKLVCLASGNINRF